MTSLPLSDMEAFDRLPPVFRHELRHAVRDYDCLKLLHALEQGWEADELLRRFRQTDGRRGPVAPIERSGRMSGRERRALKVPKRPTLPLSPSRATRTRPLAAVGRVGKG